jgi:DNA helicase HerA-like ATPase
MLIGAIEGKTSTDGFTFLAKEEPRNFDYVQVFHPVYQYVLCQITEITKTTEGTSATCQIIGYRDGKHIKMPRIPFEPGTEVLAAEDAFITSVINLPAGEDTKNYAIIGKLESRDILVPIDLTTLLTKHVAVLAKSGAGKSYTVGVLLEEIAERRVPLLVIDPHGEYIGLGKKNDEKNITEKLAAYKLETTSYTIKHYADINLIPEAQPLRLPTKLSAQEFAHLLPGKLTASQQAILYSALKNLKEVTFDNLLYELDAEESPAKFNLIAIIDYLRGLSIFSAVPTPYNELIKPGQATIINLKGINPDAQEIVVYKLCKDLFELRKQNKISPFFLVIEEAHNYAPERSFGETKASKILRDIASEGRKFGLGLCVVSQRPARVDKSVLSQCSTQIILKVTNPNDLKALSSSIEGLTAEAEKEIKNLSIGTALITGITDLPLFVTVRPRRTKHGGDAVDILGMQTKEPAQDLLAQAATFAKEQKLFPFIIPSISKKDLEIMSEQSLTIKTILLPAYQLICREGENIYKLLVERERGSIITNKDSLTSKKLPELHKLSQREISILQHAFSSKTLSLQDLATKIGGSIIIEQEIAPLISQEYLLRNGDTITISDRYLFSKLSTVPNYDTIQFTSLAFDEERTALLSIDDIKQSYEKFTTVEDFHECHIVHYETTTTG